MCGIVGYLGNNNAYEVIFDGLANLEYRGYDSAGIALNIDDGIAIFKESGRVQNLKDKTPYIFSNVGIGHTRWATHGVPSEINAHPHFSSTRRFAIVHNGIINNYKELKNKYLSSVKFYSDTDSEVLVNLIEYFCKTHDVINSLNQVIKIIDGSFSILLLDSYNLNRIYFIKNQTPLIIGKGINELIFVSDVCALKEDIKNICLLDDKYYGYIENNTVSIYYNAQKIEELWATYNPEKNENKLDTYSHHMLKEIYEQPLLIDNLIKKYLNGNKITIPSHIKEKIKKADKIFIIACGSSYYSGLVGKKYIESNIGKEVEVILASEAIYSFPLINKKPYFIFISQSGETLDVINILKRCIELNYDCLGITNSPSSSLTRLCEDVLYLDAGREIAVASTKAFFGQSLLLYILSNCLKTETPNINDNLISLKDEIKNILSNTKPIETLAKKIKNAKDVFYIGRGIDYIISLEAALKLKEISYIHAEAFPSGELKHGTIALLDSSSVVISLITQENTASILRANIKECEVRNARTYSLTSKNISSTEDTYIIDSINYELRPLAITIVIQLLAFYVALYKGLDIDKPRNLAKSVTVE